MALQCYSTGCRRSASWTKSLVFTENTVPRISSLKTKRFVWAALNTRCTHRYRQPIVSSVSTPTAWMSSLATASRKYSDDAIRKILTDVKTIAIVGASGNAQRPSHFAMSYLQGKGYRCIPINPGAAKSQEISYCLSKCLDFKKILGETAFESISDVPASIKIDMVDVYSPGIAVEAVTRGADVLWLQLGVVSPEAEQIASAAGMRVVMDRCPKIEFSRLFGELGWHGFNSEVISAKRRTPGRASAAQSLGFPASEMQFETKAIHAGAMPCPTTGARQTPIYQTTAFAFEDTAHAASLFDLKTFGNIYGRLSNPTTAVLEERIASLDGGRGSTCTSSGHAAQLLCLFPLMEPGTKIVASNKLYGGSVTQFAKTISKFDWSCTFVDTDDLDAVRDAVSDSTCRLLWAESLANPGGVITDLAALADIAHAVDIPFVVDNSAATPYLCRPIEHGADLVVYSTTKFMSGHGHALGGAVVDSGKFDWQARDPTGCRFPSLTAPEPAYHDLVFAETFGDLAFTTFGHAVSLRDIGCTMAPQNAFLTLLGVETLAVRMERHCTNAQRVAEFLTHHPQVEWVSYGGLPSSPYHTLAQRYMPKGAGALFTFGVTGGFDAGKRVVERARLFSHVANFGDTRSTILHPASTTHRQLKDQQRRAAGAGDDVIRVSIGIENVEDLIRDLTYALGDGS